MNVHIKYTAILQNATISLAEERDGTLAIQPKISFTPKIHKLHIPYVMYLYTNLLSTSAIYLIALEKGVIIHKHVCSLWLGL